VLLAVEERRSHKIEHFRRVQPATGTIDLHLGNLIYDVIKGTLLAQGALLTQPKVANPLGFFLPTPLDKGLTNLRLCLRRRASGPRAT
jgi:hypothetical protein